jgi:DNA polymerase I-like protein with 3'-5' exonuclease and polymerase domains
VVFRGQFGGPESPAGARVCTEGPYLPEWAKLAQKLAIDIETDASVDVMTGKVTAFVFSDGESAHFIDMRYVDRYEGRYLCEALLHNDTLIIGHNIRFDLMWLRHHYGVEYPRSAFLWDTMLAEQVMYAGLQPEFDLESTVEYYTKHTLDKSLQLSFDVIGPFSDEQKRYAVADVLWLPALWEAQLEKLLEQDLMGIYDIEIDVLRVFAEMERIGLSIDQEQMNTRLEEAGQTHATLQRYLQDELTPHVHNLRIDKFDSKQGPLDEWMLQYETAEWDYRFKWYEYQHYQINIDGHPDMEWEYDRKWNDWKINKKDNQPEGQRRYVKWMMKKWRETNPRPLRPKLDTSFINLNSDDQMIAAFKTLGISLPNYRKVSLALALADTESEYLQEILTSLLSYKSLEKLLTAFGPKLVARIGPDGRLRGNFMQIGTATGRPSSSRPNMLTMPKRGKNKYFRRLFVPGPGNLFVRADYSQMELRLVAEQSGDTAMQRAFKTGVDLHTYTASLMFKVDIERVTEDQRATAKTINFGILYGMGANKLRSTLAEQGIRLSANEAYAAVKLWKTSYPQAAHWIDRTGWQALKDGWTATPLGRKRYFDDPATVSRLSRGKLNEEQAAFSIKREGANHPIQGGNADITKIAMALIYDALGEDGKIVLTIYDEILVEVCEALSGWAREVVYTGMMVASEMVLKSVPSAVEAEVTRSWSSDDRVHNDSLSKPRA